MSEKVKINFEDFKLENITDPNYKSVAEPETPEVTPEAPEVEPVKGKHTPDEVIKPSKELEVNPGLDIDEDDDEEVLEDVPSTLDLKPFYNLFHEKLGWEITEDNMPENSVEGLVGYMNSLVEEASKPQYSNEIVANFDKYVANGGDPRMFMQTMFGSKDYSKIELTTDSVKKEVLSDYLATMNPDKDSTWVSKKIQRYEDSGVLDEESLDALEELKERDLREKSTIVNRQQEERLAAEEAHQRQLQDLERTIISKQDIAGIPVNQKDMKDFYNFLTKPDKDGYTAYEKALREDKEAVIKMAFIAYKKFDVNNLKTNVKSDVVKDVKKSLSRFSASNNDLHSRTGIPQKSKTIDYKAFDTGL